MLINNIVELEKQLHIISDSFRTENSFSRKRLKLLEDFWIKNNFSITEKDLERIVKN